MNEHKNEIQIEILIFKRILESVPDIEALETKLISEINPIWNLRNREGA